MIIVQQTQPYMFSCLMLSRKDLSGDLAACLAGVCASITEPRRMLKRCINTQRRSFVFENSGIAAIILRSFLRDSIFPGRLQAGYLPACDQSQSIFSPGASPTIHISIYDEPTLGLPSPPPLMVLVTAAPFRRQTSQGQMGWPNWAKTQTHIFRFV